MLVIGRLSFLFKGVKLEGSETPADLSMVDGDDIICRPATALMMAAGRTWQHDPSRVSPLLCPDVPRTVCPFCKKDVGKPSTWNVWCRSLNDHLNNPANLGCRVTIFSAAMLEQARKEVQGMP